MFNKQKRKQKKLKVIIEKSNLFDNVYYLKTYDDVRSSDFSPLEHYVKFGIKENRKPNKEFDPIWYTEHYTDVKNDGYEPFIHYIKHGKEEGRAPSKDALNIKPKLIEYKSIKKEPKRNDYDLIKDSEYFDYLYYLDKYQDIKHAEIDPIEHYLKYGYKEGRNPSSLFDTNFYLNKYSDVKNSKLNPLVHYLKYGHKENRLTFEIKDNTLSQNYLNKLFNKQAEIPKFEIDKPIDIIIPVYNGYEFLEPLFNSIINNTNFPYRLLICDDKSSDDKVLPLLNIFVENNPNIDVILLQNEQNLGFIKTVNKLSQHTNNHFVLLNTDTELPKNWIERLMYPIFEMENIASTTPFTNAGTICSFPNYLEDNKILNNMNVNNLDEYFSYVNFKNAYIEIPTGVGFCMGVNKDLVDKIGMFDEIFGKGYGEENDWCQRAIKEGYKNIHVPNLFVYHKHGGSFSSEEKRRLIETNLKTLNEKHNGFDQQVQKTIQENKLEILRSILYFKILSKSKYSNLIFDHSLGGGANHYIDEVISNKIKNNEVIFKVSYDFKESHNYNVSFKTEDKTFDFDTKSILNLTLILQEFNFSEIFINSFVSYPNVEDMVVLIEKLKLDNTKLIIPIHDFFPLCPSYTLLNHHGVFCNIPKVEECNRCLKLHNGEFKQFELEDNINTWRSNWIRLYEVCTSILCFSNSSKEIFLKTYPKFGNKIKVIPHNIEGRYSNIYNKEIDKQKNIIGILGGINEAKGANIVKSLVKKIKDKKLNAKVVLIGEMSTPIQPSDYFHYTGRYNHNDLPNIVKEQKITQFLIPSIWPETFSYTTDEIMQLGYPLTVFNLGAPAERVKNYTLGKVIELDEINKLFE